MSFKDLNVINNRATPEKFCIYKHSLYDLSVSFKDLHVINNRATPENFCLYKHLLLLHSLFNKQQPPLHWI